MRLFLFFFKKNAIFLAYLLHSIKIHLIFTSLNNKRGTAQYKSDMATLTVYQNTNTLNVSFSATTWSEKNIEQHEFESVEAFHAWFNQVNCTDSGSQRYIRVKRASGSQFGDAGGGSLYTRKMAENDFAKYAK